MDLSIPPPLAGKRTYAGLFMIALATLMFEILLTRIFSVTMWYHFAFMAVSVAMFGMTVGAILVYLLPQSFTPERVGFHLGLSSLSFAGTAVLALMVHLRLPVEGNTSIPWLASLGLTYVATSVPFVFSGISVCLVLTQFPKQVSKLYAADLAGAGTGCVLVIYALKVTSGPGAVIVVAFLASLAAVLFLGHTEWKALRRVALGCSLLSSFVAIVEIVLLTQQAPLFRLIWAKGKLESPPLYEKWNSFSRIRVEGDPYTPGQPVGWGLSSAYPAGPKIRQLNLNIDASASTVLTACCRNLNDLEHLKYDVTNLAHYIRKDAKVLVVGTGGGRDILSALVFEQKAIVGVEMNGDIVNTVNRRFGEFTGHLDRNPRVRFVNDEARSYIARSKEKFDIIQVSLIDTWAATAAGAFVLAEHSLYTVEAWKIFLDHLTPNGVLTFSRWYDPRVPGQMYRLTALATASLGAGGVGDPRRHVVIVRQMPAAHEGDQVPGIGTLLVGKNPFSASDLATVEEIATKMHFDVVLSPSSSLDPSLATIASGENLDAFVRTFPINIAPPTDDSPFFFHLSRLRNVFHRGWRSQVWKQHHDPVVLLGFLLLIMVGLCVACIIIPLVWHSEKSLLRGSWPLSLFFSSIGLGFMLVEISQMQRLAVFLGHPTYSLSVVLFTLLLSSGLGSYSTRSIHNPGGRGSANLRLLFLLGALVIFGLLTPYAITAFQGATTVIRILVAIGILLPLGLFMGMAFPLGMKIASSRFSSLTPWLWGINGAMSVCASVLEVAIALTSGISKAFWAGFWCYVIAFLAFAWLRVEGSKQ